MGTLIVIDGLDGSGKNTQSKLLYDRLRKEGKQVCLVSFPDYESPACAPVKMYLGGEFGSDPEAVGSYAASTFFAVDRFASFRLNWKEAYDNGAIIIANRYTTANAIHQLTKLDEAEHDAFLEWLYDFEFVKLGLPVPDLTLLLKVPVEKSLELIDHRGEKKDIHENREHLKKAALAAEKCALSWGWESLSCVNETGDLMSREEIAERVYSLVCEKIF
ncbi:MAG: thymidylate kinase [Ruminococcaceae bacterium]|nr:thymidylate kinase [Oscillospiraceae bacterium]